MKSFLNNLSICMVIIGSIIGAGFITGREILTFFNKVNFFYTVVILFVGFCIGIFLTLISSRLNSKLLICFKRIVCVCNLLILICMLAGTESLFFNVFGIKFKYSIISIITITFSTFIVINGVSCVKKFSLFFVPMIIIILIALISFSDLKVFSVTPSCNENYFLPLLYIGMNCLLASPVVSDIGIKNNSKSLAFTSILVSFTLTILLSILIFIINKSTFKTDMPLLDIFATSDLLKYIFGICLYLSITTTLITSHYSCLKLISGRHLVFKIILLNLFVVYMQSFGFGNIVDAIYPMLGVVGIIYLVVIFLSLIFSLKAPRQDT